MSATNENSEEYYGENDHHQSQQQNWPTPSIQRVTKHNNILPIWKNTDTMNLNNLIMENIRISQYYKNTLAAMKTFDEVLDELYYHVSHLEPWERGTHKTGGQTGMCGGVRGVGAGGVVSTPFCIMFKFFTLKLTRKQLVTMLNHTDSPYIRALGFMYIRFCQPPETFWEWYEPYFDDEEEVDPKAGGGENMTMGQLVKLLLTKLDWYGTLFPRIPVPVQKEIDQYLREYNMRQFEEAKREREAIEGAERQQQQPEPDVSRKDERRSPPRRLENRGRERSADRGGSSRRSRSPKDSRSRHSRRRSGSPSHSRHRDRDGDRHHRPHRSSRRSRSRSQNRSTRPTTTDDDRHRQRPSKRRSSRSPDSKKLGSRSRDADRSPSRSSKRPRSKSRDEEDSKKRRERSGSRDERRRKRDRHHKKRKHRHHRRHRHSRHHRERAADEAGGGGDEKKTTTEATTESVKEEDEKKPESRSRSSSSSSTSSSSGSSAAGTRSPHPENGKANDAQETATDGAEVSAMEANGNGNSTTTKGSIEIIPNTTNNEEKEEGELADDTN